MATRIQWRPMPLTPEDPEDPGWREGRATRARHRALMACRWRDLEARGEDKRAGRLPSDWHAWMGCPMSDPLQPNDGYLQQGCICDKPVMNNPRLQREIDRQRRAALCAYLSRPDAVTMLSDAGAGSGQSAEPVLPVGVVWVQSIDSSPAPSIVRPHTQHAPYANHQSNRVLVQKPVVETCAHISSRPGRPLTIQHRYSATAHRGGERRPVGGQPLGRHGGEPRQPAARQQRRSFRIASWIAGARRALSCVWAVGRTPSGVGQSSSE